jgi:thymidylate synthase
MNKLDLDYQSLLKDILDNGVKKSDRTETGTLSVFGRQIRHKMSDGFPLLTTKKMYFKGIITELIWFLKGDTHIKYLVDNDCHIWDADAYKHYCSQIPEYSKQFTMSKEDYINKIKTDKEFAKEWGELGPVYGAQWRNWGEWATLEDKPTILRKGVDQIANLINDLKTNPDSRRLMVSAWNVGELDQMVLPPCHYSFQVYTRELSWEERSKLLDITNGPWDSIAAIGSEMDRQNLPTRAISLMWNQRSVDTPLGLPFNIASYGLLLTIIAKMVNMIPDELIGNLGDTHIYKNQIEGVKEQIGRDLTIEERIAIAVRHPKFDVFDFGIGQRDDRDFEHYLLHDHSLCDSYDIPRKTRIPFELPTLKIHSGLIQSHLLELDQIIDTFDPEITFTLDNYQFHPKIYFPLSN